MPKAPTEATHGTSTPHRTQAPNVTERKPPGRATIPTEERLFVGRSEAAQMLSISCRALDYLIGKKQLNTRRIGSRVLIPMADLLHFCQGDHPARLVG